MTDTLTVAVGSRLGVAYVKMARAQYSMSSRNLQILRHQLFPQQQFLIVVDPRSDHVNLIGLASAFVGAVLLLNAPP